MLTLRERIKRALAADAASGDAAVFAAILAERIQMIRRMNSTSENPQDLCPMCAGYRWGRPRLANAPDFTRRQCSETFCGHIREEPEC